MWAIIFFFFVTHPCIQAYLWIQTDNQRVHVVHLINTSQNVWFWRDREYRKNEKVLITVSTCENAMTRWIYVSHGIWPLFAILTMCSFSFLIRIWGNAEVRITISFFFCSSLLKQKPWPKYWYLFMAYGFFSTENFRITLAITFFFFFSRRLSLRKVWQSHDFSLLHRRFWTWWISNFSIRAMNE